MTRFVPSLRSVPKAFALCLVVGCTGQVDSGSPNPVSPAGGGGSGPVVGGGKTGGAGGAAVVPNPMGGTGPTNPGTGGSTGPGPVVQGDPNAAGVRPLRLLTRREYLNTVKDLLLDSASVMSDGLPDEANDPAADYPFRATGAVATLDATNYRQAAETLAAAAVGRMNMLLPCASSATATNDTACLNTFMTTLAQRTYRRPLSAGEKTKLMALYNIAKSAPPTGLGLNFSGSIGLLLEAMLQSAEFLYHWEVDSTKADIDPAAMAQGKTVVRLGSYEIANRLSYFVWGTMPDQMLFDLAANGQLKEASVVEAQVRRMLKDSARAGAMFSDFFVDWLDIDTLPGVAKDPTLYKQFTETLTTAMVNEVQSFVTSTMTSGSGRFSDIMTGTNSFANAELATIYKVQGVTGTAMKAVMLNPAERSGLFTTGAFMSVTGNTVGSDPPRRGKVVLNKLLCRDVPPPMGEIPDPKPITPGVSTRQRFEEHSQDPCTASCHKILDPLGFAFENYDGIGQFRTTDSGQPVNASVTLILDGGPKTVANAKEMLALMAGSEEIQTCFTKQLFRYALGRIDSADDSNSVSTAKQTFRTTTGDIRELVVGLTTSRTFRYRTPSEGEVLQ